MPCKLSIINLMLYSQTKPINLHSSNLNYFKHKSQLENIENAPICLSRTNPLETKFRKMHIRSVSYHHYQESSKINKQNEKIIHRLLQISHRRKGLGNPSSSHSKIKSFQSPVRKQRERIITQENYNLAVKIINNRSQFDPLKVKKQIREYEQLKKTLYNNKKLTTVRRLRPAFLAPTHHSVFNNNEKMKESSYVGANEIEPQRNVGKSSEKGLRHMRVSSV